MLVQAMKLRVADVLSDGTVIASLSRSQGHTYAKLTDGRRLVAPDHYLLGITRPKAQDAQGPEDEPQGGLEGTESHIRTKGHTALRVA
jgi:hypothetical protein